MVELQPGSVAVESSLLQPKELHIQSIEIERGKLQIIVGSCSEKVKRGSSAMCNHCKLSGGVVDPG